MDKECKITNAIVFIFKSQLHYLYVDDWKKSHGITRDVEMNNKRKYLEAQLSEDRPILYSEWMDEFGYDGECYVCFGEFLDCEYQDESYIESLLNNDTLYQFYKRIREYEEEMYE